MLQRLFDRRWFRISFAVVVGVPLTWFTLLGSLHGILICEMGCKEDDFLNIGICVGTIFAILGVAGVWLRVIRTRTSMTDLQVKNVRWFLWAGVTSSLLLILWSWQAETWALTLFFIGLTVGGILFLIATPVSPAISHETQNLR